MKIYSNHITESDVRDAFVAARNLGANIFIEDGRVNTWRSRAYAHGIKVFGVSNDGRRASVHGGRAASWDDWGYVIAYLFCIDPAAKIGLYDGKSDFIAKVTKMAPYRRSDLAFLGSDCIPPLGSRRRASIDTPSDPIVFGPAYERG